jgi:LPPG:FO 2-phospho-L-lactate transferase
LKRRVRERRVGGPSRLPLAPTLEGRRDGTPTRRSLYARAPRVAVLAGGVGGARFIRGLAQRIEARRITIVGNTGDDDTFFGLHVSPDLDTILYTLTGRADAVQGWGLGGDTFACLAALGALGMPTWFQLGDRDLATNLLRTTWLRAGRPLSDVTAELARRYGLRARLVPMSDDPVRTFIHTERGRLAFQDYLVRGRGRGRVRRIELDGVRRARPAPGVLAALRSAPAVLIAPSNPLVSIGPILALPGVREALARRRARVAAVSPLVGNRPLKGPLHRMLRGLGLEVSPLGIARLYRGVIGLLAIDRADAAWAPRLERTGIRVLVTDTVMRTPARAARLAAAVLDALEAGRR